MASIHALRSLFIYLALINRWKFAASQTVDSGLINKALLEVKTLDDDGNPVKNDGTKYLLVETEGDSVEYTFKPDARCCGVVYGTNDVWVHDPSYLDHPTKVSLDLKNNTLVVKFPSDTLDFEFEDGRWKSKTKPSTSGRRSRGSRHSRSQTSRVSDDDRAYHSPVVDSGSDIEVQSVYQTDLRSQDDVYSVREAKVPSGHGDDFSIYEGQVRSVGRDTDNFSVHEGQVRSVGRDDDFSVHEAEVPSEQDDFSIYEGQVRSVGRDDDFSVHEAEVRSPDEAEVKSVSEVEIKSLKDFQAEPFDDVEIKSLNEAEVEHLLKHGSDHQSEPEVRPVGEAEREDTAVIEEMVDLDLDHTRSTKQFMYSLRDEKFHTYVPNPGYKFKNVWKDGRKLVLGDVGSFEKVQIDLDRDGKEKLLLTVKDLPDSLKEPSDHASPARTRKTLVPVDILTKRDTNEYEYSGFGGALRNVYVFNAKSGYKFNKVVMGKYVLFEPPATMVIDTVVVDLNCYGKIGLHVLYSDETDDSYVLENPEPALQLVNVDLRRRASTDVVDYYYSRSADMHTYLPKRGFKIKDVLLGDVLLASSHPSEPMEMVELYSHGPQLDMVLSLHDSDSDKDQYFGLKNLTSVGNFKRPVRVRGTRRWAEEHVEGDYTPMMEGPLDIDLNVTYQTDKVDYSFDEKNRVHTYTAKPDFIFVRVLKDNKLVFRPSGPFYKLEYNASRYGKLGLKATLLDLTAESVEVSDPDPEVESFVLDVDVKETTERFTYSFDETARVHSYRAKRGFSFNKVVKGAHELFESSVAQGLTGVDLDLSLSRKFKLVLYFGDVDVVHIVDDPDLPPPVPQDLDIMRKESTEHFEYKDEDTNVYSFTSRPGFRVKEILKAGRHLWKSGDGKHPFKVVVDFTKPGDIFFKIYLTEAQYVVTTIKDPDVMPPEKPAPPEEAAPTNDRAVKSNVRSRPESGDQSGKAGGDAATLPKELQLLRLDVKKGLESTDEYLVYLDGLDSVCEPKDGYAFERVKYGTKPVWGSHNALFSNKVLVRPGADRLTIYVYLADGTKKSYDIFKRSKGGSEMQGPSLPSLPTEPTRPSSRKRRRLIVLDINNTYATDYISYFSDITGSSHSFIARTGFKFNKIVKGPYDLFDSVGARGIDRVDLDNGEYGKLKLKVQIPGQLLSFTLNDPTPPQLLKLDVKRSNRTTAEYTYSDDNLKKLTTFEANPGHAFSRVKFGSKRIWNSINTEFSNRVLVQALDDRTLITVHLSNGTKRTFVVYKNPS